MGSLGPAFNVGEDSAGGVTVLSPTLLQSGSKVQCRSHLAQLTPITH